MDKIKIPFLVLMDERKISISPSSLRKIIRLVVDRIFAEHHISDKSFGPADIVGIRICFLEKRFEMIVMVISEFNKHQYIGISVSDGFFYRLIVGIVLVDIGKKHRQ